MIEINSIEECIKLKTKFESVTKISIKERLFCPYEDNEESVIVMKNIIKCINLKTIRINSYETDSFNELVGELADLTGLKDIEVMVYKKIDGFTCANTQNIFISKKNNLLVRLYQKVDEREIIKIMNDKKITNITMFVNDKTKCEYFCNNLNYECEELKIIIVLSSDIKSFNNLSLTNLPPSIQKINIFVICYILSSLRLVSNEYIENISNFRENLLKKTKIPFGCKITYADDMFYM